MWVVTMILAAIFAPFISFFIALSTFISSFFTFVASVHEGLMKIKYPDNTPPIEEEDVWDRHVRKLQEKEQQK